VADVELGECRLVAVAGVGEQLGVGLGGDLHAAPFPGAERMSPRFPAVAS
jgi:hypothetical protein